MFAYFVAEHNLSTAITDHLSTRAYFPTVG